MRPKTLHKATPVPEDECEEDQREFIAAMLKDHVDHQLWVSLEFASTRKNYTLLCLTCADEEVMWSHIKD